MIGYQYTIKFIQLREAIMYLAHYGLKLKPFNISPDPRFLWLGERHREALATLRYGIQENKGFLLLTGDVGTGKTVLINRLIKLIDLKVIVATIPDPGLGLNYLYNDHLSQLRANMVKSYLVGRGAANSQIRAIGLGPKNPIGDNENREGRSKNRRVEIKFRLSTKGDVKNKKHSKE